MAEIGDILIVVGGVALAIVGLCMALNLFGLGDRAARGGKDEKHGYSGRDQAVDWTVLFMPTTRAGARRMGVALFVLFGFGVYLQLTGR